MQLGQSKDSRENEIAQEKREKEVAAIEGEINELRLERDKLVNDREDFVRRTAFRTIRIGLKDKLIAEKNEQKRSLEQTNLILSVCETNDEVNNEKSQQLTQDVMKLLFGDIP